MSTSSLFLEFAGWQDILFSYFYSLQLKLDDTSNDILSRIFDVVGVLFSGVVQVLQLIPLIFGIRTIYNNGTFIGDLVRAISSPLSFVEHGSVVHVLITYIFFGFFIIFCGLSWYLTTLSRNRSSQSEYLAAFIRFFISFVSNAYYLDFISFSLRSISCFPDQSGSKEHCWSAQHIAIMIGSIIYLIIILFFTFFSTFLFQVFQLRSTAPLSAAHGRVSLILLGYRTYIVAAGVLMMGNSTASQWPLRVVLCCFTIFFGALCLVSIILRAPFVASLINRVYGGIVGMTILTAIYGVILNVIQKPEISTDTLDLDEQVSEQWPHLPGSFWPLFVLSFGVGGFVSQFRIRKLTNLMTSHISDASSEFDPEFLEALEDMLLREANGSNSTNKNSIGMSIDNGYATIIGSTADFQVTSTTIRSSAPNKLLVLPEQIDTKISNKFIHEDKSALPSWRSAVNSSNNNNTRKNESISSNTQISHPNYNQIRFQTAPSKSYNIDKASSNYSKYKKINDTNGEFSKEIDAPSLSLHYHIKSGELSGNNTSNDVDDELSFVPRAVSNIFDAEQSNIDVESQVDEDNKEFDQYRSASGNLTPLRSVLKKAINDNSEITSRNLKLTTQFERINVEQEPSFMMNNNFKSVNTSHINNVVNEKRKLDNNKVDNEKDVAGNIEYFPPNQSDLLHPSVQDSDMHLYNSHPHSRDMSITEKIMNRTPSKNLTNELQISPMVIFKSFCRSQLFTKYIDMEIFDTDCELLFRKILLDWNVLSNTEKALSRMAMLRIFLGILHFSKGNGSFLFLNLAQIERSFFKNLSAATIFVRAGYLASKALDYRFFAFSLQKQIDSDQLNNGLNTNRARSANLADLDQFRKTFATAKFNHHRSLKLLFKSVRHLINDDRIRRRNSVPNDSGKYMIKGDSTIHPVESDGQSGISKFSSTTSNIVKNRIQLIEESLKCLQAAESAYKILSQRFSSNPEAISFSRAFRKHFFYDEIDSNSGNQRGSFSGGSKDEDSSFADSSSQTSSQIGNDQDSLKKQKLQSAIDVTSRSFTTVRVGVLIGVLIVAVIIFISSYIIQNRLNRIDIQMNSLISAEELFTKWPRACQNVFLIGLIFKDFDVLVVDPIQSGIDSVVASITDFSDLPSICESALSNSVISGYTYNARECRIGLEDGSSASIVTTSDDVTFTRTSLSDYSTQSWFTAAYLSTATPIGGRAHFASDYESLSGTTIQGLSYRLVNPSNANEYAIMTIGITVYPAKTMQATLGELLEEDQTTLKSSLEKLLEDSTSDPTGALTDSLLGSYTLLRNYNYDGTYAERYVTLQEMQVVFSADIDTILGFLNITYFENETFWSSPSYLQLQGFCSGTIIPDMQRVTTAQTTAIHHTITSSTHLMLALTCVSVSVVIILTVITLHVIRKYLGVFDSSDGVPLSVKILLELDRSSLKVLAHRLRSAKLPNDADVGSMMDIEELPNYFNGASENVNQNNNAIPGYHGVGFKDSDAFAEIHHHEAHDNYFDIESDRKAKEHKEKSKKGKKLLDSPSLESKKKKDIVDGAKSKIKLNNLKEKNPRYSRTDSDDNPEEAIKKNNTQDEKLRRKKPNKNSLSVSRSSSVSSSEDFSNKRVHRKNNDLNKNYENKKHILNNHHAIHSNPEQDHTKEIDGSICVIKMTPSMKTELASESESEKIVHKEIKMPEQVHDHQQQSKIPSNKSKDGRRNSVVQMQKTSQEPDFMILEGNSMKKNSWKTKCCSKAFWIKLIHQFVENAKRIVKGPVSRWIALCWIIIAAECIAVGINGYSSVLFLKERSDELDTVIQLQAQMSFVNFRYICVIQYDIPGLMYSTEFYRRIFSNGITDASTRWSSLAAERDNDGVAILRRTTERQELVYSDVCVNPSGCSTVSSYYTFLESGLYKAFTKWAELATDLYVKYGSSTDSSWTMQLYSPTEGWEFINYYPDLLDGFQSLVSSFIFENRATTSKSTRTAWLLMAYLAAALVVILVFADQIIKRQKKRLHDSLLVLRILPWATIVQNSILQKAFHATENNEDDDEEEEEDMDEEMDEISRLASVSTSSLKKK